jgi:hypothetical protein
MGIERFIQKICVQTAVYWASPVNDGYGTFTFDDPVEISCRWEDKSQVTISDMKRGSLGQGKEITSDAEILVTQDLDKNGYLYLGSLSDLTDAEKANPATIEDARQILSVDKIPWIKSTSIFVRKVYLRRKYYVE